VARLTGFNGN